jgi:radical SAM protein with 4Fe4S-binding SPASM domain
MRTLASEHIILRRENFGGVVFNPRTGNQIDLDHSAFDTAVRIFAQKSVVDRGFESSFYKKMLAELGDVPSGVARLVEPSEITATEFRVLRSPSLADIQITSACTQGCPHCYASANPAGTHMPYSDLLRILDSCAEAGVFQIALGGGDPLLHPQFEDILYAVRERGMVPNVTTSGAYFTEKNLAAMRECCGAVALSLEGVGARYSQRRALGWDGFRAALATLEANSIPTVLQVTVGAGNINDVSRIVDFALSKKLYGVIFLAYKPVGRGQRFDGPLSKLPGKKVAEVFSDAFVRLSDHTRVGFDCCLSAIVAGLNHDIFGASNSELDGCSALRGSMGISVNQTLSPCTFTEQFSCGSLKEHSVSQLWRSPQANSFRANHEAAVNANSVCSPCAHKRTCMGGCPVYNLGRCASYGSEVV